MSVKLLPRTFTERKQMLFKYSDVDLPVPASRSKGSKRDPYFHFQGNTPFWPHFLPLPKHTDTDTDLVIFNGASPEDYYSAWEHCCIMSHVTLEELCHMRK